MRQEWSTDDMISAWTLVEADWALVGNKTGATRLANVAEQVKVAPGEFTGYWGWGARSSITARRSARPSGSGNSPAVLRTSSPGGWPRRSARSSSRRRPARGAAGALPGRAHRVAREDQRCHEVGVRGSVLPTHHIPARRADHHRPARAAGHGRARWGCRGRGRPPSTPTRRLTITEATECEPAADSQPGGDTADLGNRAGPSRRPDHSLARRQPVQLAAHHLRRDLGRRREA